MDKTKEIQKRPLKSQEILKKEETQCTINSFFDCIRRNVEQLTVEENIVLKKNRGQKIFKIQKFY